MELFQHETIAKNILLSCSKVSAHFGMTLMINRSNKIFLQSTTPYYDTWSHFEFP